MYIHIHPYTHIHMHTYVQWGLLVYARVRTLCIHMYICIYIDYHLGCVYIAFLLYIHIRYLYMHVYIYRHIYVYVHACAHKHWARCGCCCGGCVRLECSSRPEGHRYNTHNMIQHMYACRLFCIHTDLLTYTYVYVCTHMCISIYIDMCL